MENRQGLKRDILKYLNVCESALKNSSEGDTVPNPYSSANLRANFPEPEAENLISEILRNRETHNSDNYTDSHLLSDKGELKEDELSLGSLAEMSRRDIIKLLVYLNAEIHLISSGKLPTPQDAVFPVKNTLILADDFVPKEFMIMIEGPNEYDASDIIKRIQPPINGKILLGLGTEEGGYIKYWKYLVPLRFSSKTDYQRIYNELVSFFESEVSKMETSPWYSNFIFGRITRSVVYQLSRKNRRSLMPPLFTDYYIRILTEHDLVDLDKKPIEIRKDIDLDSLKNINEEAEKLSSILAEKWLDEKIQLPSGIL